MKLDSGKLNRFLNQNPLNLVSKLIENIPSHGSSPKIGRHVTIISSLEMPSFGWPGQLSAVTRFKQVGRRPLRLLLGHVIKVYVTMCYASQVNLKVLYHRMNRLKQADKKKARQGICRLSLKGMSSAMKYKM